MAGPATILRELHRLRRHAKDLQNEIERAPRLLKGQQTRITRQEEGARDAHDQVKKLQLAIREKESQLKSTLQLIEKHEQQLNQATSKKEYDALKAEITSDKKKCQQLEDQILELMGQVEDKTAQIPAAEKAVLQAKQEYAEFEKSSQLRLAGLSEQLDKTQNELKEVEATLPSDVRPHYERMVNARGDDALAVVENRTCMACYTEITAQAFNDLMLSQFVVCKSCGRALYLPE